MVGALIRVIGEILSWIGDALNWLQEVIFLAGAGILGWVCRGDVRAIATALWRLFNRRGLAIAGFVALAAGAIGWACEYAGKGVMWLGYWLIEQGGRLGGDDRFADGIRKERDRSSTQRPARSISRRTVAEQLVSRHLSRPAPEAEPEPM